MDMNLNGTKKHTYSKEDIEFIKAHAHKGRKWLAEAMNRPLASVTAAMKNRGIKTGNTGHFKKGQNPWNAGRTDIRMSPETEFKKGQLPLNTLYDGAVTLRNDRCSKTGKLRRYKYIRISKAKWELYHRYLWMQHNGPIPKKHIVRFKNGDTLDCRIENLELVSMKENARRNRNREKFRKTLKLLIEEGDHPSVNLTDSYIVGNLSRGNRSIKEQIKKRPELIELKRNQLKLNRHINGKTK